VEAEEKVLTAQFTSDISDNGSSKKRKSKGAIDDSINLNQETAGICILFLFYIINLDLKIIIII